MRYFSICVGAANGDSLINMPLDQDEDPDPIVVQFTVQGLTEGTHFFVVTAYNTEGFESGYSNEVKLPARERGASRRRRVSTGGTVGDGGGGVR